jgi:hypothetical protein
VAGGGARTSSVGAGADGSITVTYYLDTGTSVSSSENPSVAGDQVTYTAVVAPTSGNGIPTGSVTFEDNGSSISCSGGDQTLSVVDGQDQATCEVTYSSAGSHPITAVYSGDSTYEGTTGSLPTQTVNALLAPTAKIEHPPSGGVYAPEGGDPVLVSGDKRAGAVLLHGLIR